MKKYRKAIFCVIYSNENNKLKFLLLKRKLHWKGWEFPKGKIEKNESKISTAIRETQEETGIKTNNRKIKDHKISGSYLYKKILKDRPGIIGQTYYLFSAEVRIPKKIILDNKEHSGYKWVNFEKAIKMLTYPNQRKCLRIVKKYLNTKMNS